MTEKSHIKEQALALAPEDRAELIEELLHSFDPTAREAIDAACAEEVESRLTAFAEGKLHAISLEESRRRLGKQ